jgi:serine/threonine protein kinase
MDYSSSLPSSDVDVLEYDDEPTLDPDILTKADDENQELPGAETEVDDEKNGNKPRLGFLLENFRGRYRNGIENPNEYHPGGYHPIHLGDHVGADDRFQIVAKLDASSIATVWLCKDHHADVENDDEAQRWKSLRVFRADSSTGESRDLAVRTKLCQTDDSDSDKDSVRRKHIILPLEEFYIDGPNGHHLVLVLPLLGPSVDVIPQHFAPNLNLVKDTVFRLTEALQFLHDRGICHGDIRPQSMHFGMSPAAQAIKGEKELLWRFHEPENEVFRVISDTTKLSRKKGEKSFGEPNPHVPQYVAAPMRIRLDSGLVTRESWLVDFSEAYFPQLGDDAGPPGSDGIKVKSEKFPYAAPELQFACRAGESSGDADVSTYPSTGFATDIWALGCTITELYGGLPPFKCDSVAQAAKHMEEMLGPMPALFRKGYLKRGSQTDKKGRVEIGRDEDDEPKYVAINEGTLEYWRGERMAKYGDWAGDFLAYRLRGETTKECKGIPADYSDVQSRNSTALLPGTGSTRCMGFMYEKPAEDRDLIRHLVEGMLRWRPEDRLDGGDLAAVFRHPWLQGRTLGKPFGGDDFPLHQVIVPDQSIFPAREEARKQWRLENGMYPFILLSVSLCSSSFFSFFFFLHVSFCLFFFLLLFFSYLFPFLSMLEIIFSNTLHCDIPIHKGTEQEC